MIETEKNSKILRKRSKKIDEVTDEVKDLVLKMEKVMDQEEGIGLAAPQIGELKRIILVREGDQSDCFINPIILEKSKEKDLLEEGCLSCPGISVEIERPVEIRIRATNLDGEEFESEIEGLKARVFQHETDHLDGILITDYIPLLSKIKKFLRIK